MDTTYLQSLNAALFEIFGADDRVFMIGEDIMDPYGGAFKVGRGLSTAFPGRVLNTPISEACITGMGGGMAVRGLRPVIEIMFGDFITLSADQIINHIAKFARMYGGQVEVPVTIRTPMGGGRGYGPTHSQSLEKLFLGVPGLKVVASSHFHDPGGLLRYAVLEDDGPVLFIEHKLLYPVKTCSGGPGLSVETVQDESGYPAAVVKNYETGEPDVVVVAYGGMSRLLEPLLAELRDEEIKVAACLPSLISAAPPEILAELVDGCGRAVVVEEGAGLFGWSAEVASWIYARADGRSSPRVRRVASLDSVIPAARHLESMVLPGRESVLRAIEEVIA